MQTLSFFSTFSTSQSTIYKVTLLTAHRLVHPTCEPTSPLLYRLPMYTHIHTYKLTVVRSTAVAVHCSALQFTGPVAVELQCTAVHSSALNCTELQCTAVQCTGVPAWTKTTLILILLH